jgi:hypothetical protein
LNLIAAACIATAGGVQAMNEGAVNEVIKLQNAGFAEDTVISYIKGKNINYEISADDAIALRQRGVPAAVLNAMLASGGGAPAPVAPVTPQIAPVPQVQPSAPALMPSSQPVVQPMVAAPPTSNPDVTYFQQDLGPHGRWIEAEPGQWYWQPAIAVSTPGWRPYWDGGHWVYSDAGWYWASDYPWGRVAFHYGRWHLHPRHGWVWFPGRVWGPAWVVWRNGGDYCGWAPLPPYAEYDAVAGVYLFHGRRVEVGFDFGLEWGHFNFCFVRDMGSPFHGRPFREEEMRRIYHETVFVHGGIHPDRVVAVRGHEVERVRVEDVRGRDYGHDRDRGHDHRYDGDRR